MHSKSYMIAASLMFLASCDAPQEMSEVRATMDERLKAGPTQPVGADAAPIAFNQGLAPALLAAVSAHEGYRTAQALEAEAMGQIGVMASLRRPQLAGSANVGGIWELDKTADRAKGVAGGVNLSQLVYDGGASASAINRSTALALSAQAGRMAQGNEIALTAARAWIDLWQFGERLRLMQMRTSEIDTLVDQIERMASNGMLDQASLESARRQIVDIKLEESLLQAGKAEAQVRFDRFFRVKPDRINRPNEMVTSTQAQALAQDWQAAPGLQQLAAELLAAQAAVGEARSAFKPRARVQAGVRSPMDTDESTDLTVGLSLEYSFNDGGRRKKQLESAEARVAASDAQLSDAQRGLDAELQASLTRLAAIERAMPLLVDKLRLSRSEAKISRSQLLTGQSNLRQLVEAEIAIYRAQDQQIVMQAERQALLLTIAARTGALSRLIGLKD